MRSFKLALYIVLATFLLDKIIFLAILSIDKKVLTGEGLGKLNNFYLVKDTTDYIVFGSSRANHHINPEVFGKSSFNIGVGGRKMAFSATLIQTLPKHKKQYVLLQIDPSYVFDTVYDGNDIDALYIKYHEDKVIKKHIDDLNRDNFFSHFFLSLDYNGMLFSILYNRFFPRYDYKTYKGFDPIENSPTQKDIFIKRLKNKKFQSDCLVSYKASVLEKKYLNEIKDFCYSNDKVLILFTSPVYKDKCKTDNIEMVKLMKEFGLTYYDYSDFYSNDEDLDNWKDENHLSKKGANKFSVFIAKSLRSELKLE